MYAEDQNCKMLADHVAYPSRQCMQSSGWASGELVVGVIGARLFRFAAPPGVATPEPTGNSALQGFQVGH